MALAERQQKSTKTHYLELREHRICKVEKTQHDESWECRIVFSPEDKEKTNPITKYYKFFDSVEGIPTDLYWHVSDCGKYKGYKLTLKDEESEEEYVLNISPTDRFAFQKFLLTAENVDWNKTLKIVVWPSPSKDKDGNEKVGKDGKAKIETAFLMYQEDEIVKRFYNVENPVPENHQPKYNERKKEWKWDDYYDFLQDKLEVIIEKNFHNFSSSESNTEIGDSPLSDDDLPF